MKTQAKVNRNGSITIPIETREALGGLNEGDIINIDVNIEKRKSQSCSAKVEIADPP